MDMLSMIAHHMIHPFSPILVYSSKHFDSYLTNKCLNVCIRFNTAPQKSTELGVQLIGLESEIIFTELRSQ